MSWENEAYLKACLKGDLHFVKENLGKLSTRTIENIRDSKNARFAKQNFLELF